MDAEFNYNLTQPFDFDLDIENVVLPAGVEAMVNDFVANLDMVDPVNSDRHDNSTVNDPQPSAPAYDTPVLNIGPDIEIIQYVPAESVSSAKKRKHKDEHEAPVERTTITARTDQKPMAKGKENRAQRKTSKGQTAKRPKSNYTGNSSDSDSDTEVVIQKNTPRRRWSLQETRKLLDALLGVDGYWDRFCKHPNRIYKKVSRKEFNGNRDPAAVKSKYKRLLETYKIITRLEGWTGNGARDPDVDQRIKAARNAAVDIPDSFTPKILTEWMDQEKWYNYFSNRLREDPSISRPVDHHSGMVSDLNEDDSQGDNDSDIDSDCDAEPPKHIDKPKKASKMSTHKRSAKNSHQYKRGVPIPKHQVRNKAGLNNTHLSEYLADTRAAMMATAEEGREKLKLLKQREARQAEQAQLQLRIERDRTEGEAERKKIAMCREIIADPYQPDQAKVMAQTYINEALRRSLGF